MGVGSRGGDEEEIAERDGGGGTKLPRGNSKFRARTGRGPFRSLLLRRKRKFLPRFWLFVAAIVAMYSIARGEGGGTLLYLVSRSFPRYLRRGTQPEIKARGALNVFKFRGGCRELELAHLHCSPRRRLRSEICFMLQPGFVLL